MSGMPHSVVIEIVVGAVSVALMPIAAWWGWRPRTVIRKPCPACARIALDTASMRSRT